MPAQLRFSDVDRFGHVNNSVYFSLFDMCKPRYFHDVVGAAAPDSTAMADFSVCKVEDCRSPPCLHGGSGKATPA